MQITVCEWCGRRIGIPDYNYVEGYCSPSKPITIDVRPDATPEEIVVAIQKEIKV